MRLLTIVTLILALNAAAQDNPFELYGKAAEAYQAGRYAESTTLFERVRQLLPGSISARVSLARSLAREGRHDDAIELLKTVVEYGVRFDAGDEAFAALRNNPRFAEVTSLMRSRSAPIVRSEKAFLLEKDLIPENIVFDPTTGDFFVGSMYKAKIIRIGRDGKVTDFVPSRRDGLLGVLGMKIDARKRELWANAGNFGDRPPLQTPDPASLGKGALYRFDLDTGKLIRRYPAPGGSPEQPLLFNDLVLAPNGDVFTTAGPGGIFRLRNGAAAPEVFIEPDGSFWNGIAITPDGRTLFGASHVHGVARIDVATRARSFIDVPAGATLGGIDGLYFHDGSLIGVQNGTDPSRVIRAWLDPELSRVTRFAVLEQDHPDSDIPLTGVVVGNDLYYVALSQLRAFEGGKIWPMERLKESVILKLPLDLPATGVDLQKERQSLLEVHRQEIRAHFERDAAWIGSTTLEPFVSVSSGKIERSTAEELRTFFTGYFDGATYLQYEDAEPPIVRVSDDGSMGWLITRTRVRRTQNGQERSFVYAGIMTYEKRGGQWVRVANVSTFE
jgi:hypothetical protein